MSIEIEQCESRKIARNIENPNRRVGLRLK